MMTRNINVSCYVKVMCMLLQTTSGDNVKSTIITNNCCDAEHVLADWRNVASSKDPNAQLVPFSRQVQVAHTQSLVKDSEWMAESDLYVASKIFNMRFIVHAIQEVTDCHGAYSFIAMDNFCKPAAGKDVVHLLYWDRKHFDVLVPCDPPSLVSPASASTDKVRLADTSSVCLVA